MSVSTTLKLPEALRERIVRLAKESNKSAHSLMVEALEREIAARSACGHSFAKP